MSKASLIRLGGIAAIVAGLLRGIASFIPSAPLDVRVQAVYFFTDLFILLGCMALYSVRHQAIGSTGFVGFLSTIIGIQVIRSSQGITGANLYSVGAFVFSVGLALLGIRLWIVHILPGWVVGLWVISLLAGIIQYFVPGLGLLFVLAGVLFAIGFAGAGVVLWSVARHLE